MSERGVRTHNRWTRVRHLRPLGHRSTWRESTDPQIHMERTCVEFPYIAASPDALVSCTCHEPGLLEIKCPWTHRGSTITQYSTDKKSCLEMVNNEPRLKRTHMYWYQVQCQKHATKRKWCDFFLCTTKDSFLERVTYNEVFFAANVEKAKVVYEKLIVPEIFTRELKSNIQLEHDIRNVINEMLTQIVYN